MQEREQQFGFAPYPPHTLLGRRGQLLQRTAGTVGQLHPFQVGPQALHRVQVGGVGGQVFDLEPLVLGGRPSAHRDTGVGGQVVPDHDHRPAAAQQPLQPTNDPEQLVGVVGALAQVKRQPGIRPVGAVAAHPRQRDPLAAPHPMPKDRGVAPGRPGATHRWGQCRAGLVDKAAPRALLCRPFLIRGHSSARQRAISASSRSLARRAGRCGLHWWRRSSHHTCPRVVADPPQPPDHLGDPRQRPQVGVEPVSLGAGQQGAFHPPPVPVGQARGAAPATGNTLALYAARDLSRAFGASLVLQANVPVPDYTIPASAAQPGTGSTLDTLDCRFVNASTQVGDSLWQVHSTAFSAAVSLATPRFYEINTATNSLNQTGQFFASNTSHDWNASIAANPAGEAFVDWSSTDPPNGTNPQVRFSGRQPSDPSGVIPAGDVLCSSQAAYDGERWGDYSAMTLDPQPAVVGGNVCDPDRTAWFVNEKVIDPGNWGTCIGAISFC